MTTRSEPRADTPPMASSDEADRRQLELARSQGDAFGSAVETMVHGVATDGGSAHAGDVIVGFAVEQAEGMYVPGDRGLEWTEPEDENCHVEVVVRDAADGRFIPGLHVTATLTDADGREVGSHEQPFLWHPWLYHYGRNWKVPGDGTYRLRIDVDAPQFGRHDKKNGRRFEEPVTVEFDRVTIETGQK